MKYKFKPNASQKREYAQMMRRREENYKFILNKGPIRQGCHIQWHSKGDDTVYVGTVSKETRRTDGQHQFTIRLDNSKGHKSVMGRNLYDSLLAHTPGEESVAKSWIKSS